MNSEVGQWERIYEQLSDLLRNANYDDPEVRQATQSVSQRARQAQTNLTIDSLNSLQSDISRLVNLVETKYIIESIEAIRDIVEIWRNPDMIRQYISSTFTDALAVQNTANPRTRYQNAAQRDNESLKKIDQRLKALVHVYIQIVQLEQDDTSHKDIYRYVLSHIMLRLDAFVVALYWAQQARRENRQRPRVYLKIHAITDNTAVEKKILKYILDISAADVGFEVDIVRSQRPMQITRAIVAELNRNIEVTGRRNTTTLSTQTLSSTSSFYGPVPETSTSSSEYRPIPETSISSADYRPVPQTLTSSLQYRHTPETSTFSADYRPVPETSASSSDYRTDYRPVPAITLSLDSQPDLTYVGNNDNNNVDNDEHSESIETYNDNSDEAEDISKQIKFITAWEILSGDEYTYDQYVNALKDMLNNVSQSFILETYGSRHTRTPEQLLLYFLKDSSSGRRMWHAWSHAREMIYGKIRKSDLTLSKVQEIL